MDNATRARLEQALTWAEDCAGEGELATIEPPDGRALLACYDALRAAQAQAAPVLAAVRALVARLETDPEVRTWDEIEALVLAWRAAREG